MAELSDHDKAILAIESSWWRYKGAKESAIRQRTGLSSTSFYQELNRLIDEPAALAHDPVLIKRLRRIRAARKRTGGIARRQG